MDVNVKIIFELRLQFSKCKLGLRKISYLALGAAWDAPYLRGCRWRGSPDVPDVLTGEGSLRSHSWRIIGLSRGSLGRDDLRSSNSDSDVGNISVSLTRHRLEYYTIVHCCYCFIINDPDFTS